MRLIATVMLLCTTAISFGQSTFSADNFSYALSRTDFKSKRVVPPSPEAADLGKYGNTPVSLFTGTPNISIPVYELKGSSLSVPVSLSYNSTGFKPQDVAPWTGLGWTLNAGGVITRSVLGNPDLPNNYYATSSYNYLNIPPITDAFANYDYMFNIQKGYMEAQPDLYSYNFNSYSGKFYIARDYSVTRKIKDNLKVVPCVNCANYYMTVTDEHGTVYEFNEVETTTEILDDQVDPNMVPEYMSYVFPSSWYLSKMTSADGSEQMLFEYYTTDSVNTQFVNYLQNQSVTYRRSTLNCGSNCTSWPTSVMNYGPAPTTQMKRKYLKRITYSKGGNTVAYIDFVSGINLRQDLDHALFKQERLLQSIQVKDNNNTLIKQVNLNYSYYAKDANSTYSRLRLDSLSEVPVIAGTPLKPGYGFTYNTGLVPAYASSVDHWGYFNNSYQPVTWLVPSVTSDNGVQLGLGANRTPNTTGASVGILNKITYPTGGYSSFIYEAHEASNITPGTNTAIGGLRIKQIIDYSFTNKQAIVKNYDYKQANGSTSSGNAIYPIYTKSSSMHHTAEPGGNGQVDTDYDIYFFTISASSVFGLGTFMGSHVGYSMVTETQTDANGTVPLGKTVYQYKIGFIDANNEDVSTGDLLQQTVYDNNGKVMTDITNTYNYPGYGGTVGYKVFPLVAQDNLNDLCKTTYNGGASYVYEWRGFWIATPPAATCVSLRNYGTKTNMIGYSVSGLYKQLITQVKKVYDPATNAYTTLTTTNTYGNLAHNQPTVTEQTSTGTENVVTINKYAADYTVPGSGTLDAATQGIQLLQNKNMVSTSIESVQYRQNTEGGNKRYISGRLSIYSPSKPYPLNLYRIESSSPLATLQASTTNGTFTYDASYKALASFTYDAWGNVNEQSRTQDAVTSYVWDYFYTMPTAEAVNANANMIAYSGFETQSTGGGWTGILQAQVIAQGAAGDKSYNLTAGNNLTKAGLPTTRQYIISYWSKSGSATVSSNIGASTLTTGSTYNTWTYYEHLLPAGSSSVTISATATKNIDELRLYPTLSTITTYTYRPLIGMTSQNNPLNQISYYDYDGYNRLVNIKDKAGNIVKNFKYNYGLGTALTSSAQSLFYNAQAQGTYTKSCSSGTGTAVTYTVLYGKYAAISQAAADAMATADINANGQAYANANGQCVWYNAVYTGFKFKNDCSYSQGSGSKVFYTVPASRYTSTVSQADADAQAAADFTANAQNNANTYGTCSCAAEGKKFINGVCTTGTRHNSSTTHMPDGTWQCTYYYTFSDGTNSQFYTTYGTSPCAIQ